ncbi:6947_t:CDS:2 [Entrophospora sp. SA101]|nr:6947_t:CDS:2 [Entrophospora sp. SA101]
MPNDNKKTKNKAKKIKEKVEEKSSELENEVRKTASKMSSDSSNTADEITNLKKEIETLKEKNLRLLADLDNQRKNYLKEISEMLEFNNKRLIGKLLLFFDSYERAIQISQAYQDPKVEQFLTGFQMTLAEVQNDFFKKEGVEEIKINLQKDTYDSKLHHALEVEENNDYPEGTILQVFQKGYRLRQQVLRRAEFKEEENIDLRKDKLALQRLKEAAENAKHKLSFLETKDPNQAVDKKTGKKEEITIKDAQGLSKEEVERMKREAEENEEKDREMRENIEKLNEAQGYLYTFEKQMEEFKKSKDFKEDDSQYQEFQKLYQNLKDAVETRNYEQIKEQLKNIEEL